VEDGNFEMYSGDKAIIALKKDNDYLLHRGNSFLKEIDELRGKRRFKF
jgi:hypothetical protein